MKKVQIVGLVHNTGVSKVYMTLYWKLAYMPSSDFRKENREEISAIIRHKQKPALSSNKFRKVFLGYFRLD